MDEVVLEGGRLDGRTLRDRGDELIRAIGSDFAINAGGVFLHEGAQLPDEIPILEYVRTERRDAAGRVVYEYVS